MLILIIEDDQVQSDNLSRLITENYPDIKVVQAYCLDEAYKLIKQYIFDLLLIDLNLPDGSGIDFAKYLRELPEYKLTGIVVITTNSHNILQTFKEIHCYDFLVKPYKNEEVKKIIQTFKENTAIDEEDDNNYSIVTLDNRVKIKVYHKEIVYVEYSYKKCIICTIKRKLNCKKTSLVKFLEELNCDKIVQSHKSFLVNVDYIAEIEKVYQKMWRIHFKGIDETADLSVRYKDNVFKVWNKEK